jgi:hypothetical protein
MTERPILPGVGGKLPGDLAERAADGLSRLGGVGIQVDIRIPLSASAIDGLYRTLPGGRDSLTAGPQHGRGGGAHAGRPCTPWFRAYEGLAALVLVPWRAAGTQ